MKSPLSTSTVSLHLIVLLVAGTALGQGISSSVDYRREVAPETTLGKLGACR